MTLFHPLLRRNFNKCVQNQTLRLCYRECEDPLLCQITWKLSRILILCDKSWVSLRIQKVVEYDRWYHAFQQKELICAVVSSCKIGKM